MYMGLVDGKVAYPAKPEEVWSLHAVLAVGYDDEKEELCIKNSWSKFWGDAGYGYLPYRYVEDFCEGNWAVKDISVTSDMLKGARNLIE
jgi:C1A family cysteine protease